MVFQGARQERLVSGSDDFTLFLWEPETNSKNIGRMTGMNHNYSIFCFSTINSFDKTKLSNIENYLYYLNELAMLIRTYQYWFCHYIIYKVLMFVRFSPKVTKLLSIRFVSPPMVAWLQVHHLINLWRYGMETMASKFSNGYFNHIV